MHGRCLTAWPRLLALASILCAVLLAGCGAPFASPAPTPTPTASPTPAPPTATPLPTTVVPVAHVEALITHMQSAYDLGNWSQVRSLFASSRAAQPLLALMQTWKVEQVKDLRTTLIYRHPLRDGKFIGTVQFSADPRTIPAYAIYLFRLVDGQPQIIGTASGVHGKTYRHATWAVTRSGHFTIYHSPYELQGTDRSIIADLEYERTQFERKFGVKVSRNIRYYWYPQQSMMGPMTTGVCGTTPEFVGCADPYVDPPVIHTSEWPSYHEPVHVYELALQPPIPPHAKSFYVAPLFISEGTAVALEDKQLDPRLSDYCSDLSYIPLDVCAIEAIRTVNPLHILSDKGFQGTTAGDAYALGGSFVKYLILHYGYHRFGRFYYVLAAQPKDRQKDYDVAARKVYHQTIAHLLTAWKTELCSRGCCNGC